MDGNNLSPSNSVIFFRANISDVELRCVERFLGERDVIL